jgi:selenide,water dikinase
MEISDFRVTVVESIFSVLFVHLSVHCTLWDHLRFNFNAKLNTMQISNTPVVKNLVLAGGGHSHLAVLMRFAMKPVPGLRLTLMTRDLHTPYSGMLPGYVAGHYDYDQTHIDLRKLTQFAGARIYHSEVTALDLENRLVLSQDRPPVSFDLLSINIGSRPGTLQVPGATELTLPVKPIDSFLSRWDELIQRIVASTGPFRLVVVGGGAGGVEMALATRYRLRQQLQQAGEPVERLTVCLLTDSDVIMPTHNSGVRRRFERVLHDRGICVQTGSAVCEVREGEVVCEDGAVIEADAVLWVTRASAPQWLGDSGLAVDEEGFIQVNDYLQSTSHSSVFAAGDIATMVNHPRPKSGVFAVRQGPPLAENLRRALHEHKLKPFRPQSKFLGLISTGDKYAIASRSGWSVEGAWVWRAKDWIDRRFMRMFSELPEMSGQQQSPQLDQAFAGEDAIKEISAMAMRCGGCGAKVGSSVLARVMNKLQPVQRDDVLIGLDAPDDAAISEVPPGKVIAQSVDYFRSFIDDPYVFGQIAANHALSDIFAMGADAQTAMAIATIPYGRERDVEEQLYQLMSGALQVLKHSNTALVGGHTSEGAELSFGLSVTGLVDREHLLRKGGMQAGDLLLLTKPLGTGTLFAADMRHQAKGRWIDAAIRHMLNSNHAAGLCLHRYGATACTDVTGFGLLGHLVEMTRASDVDVELDLDALPVMAGALQTIAAGIFSSLQPQNIRLRRAIRNIEAAGAHPNYPVLFDPQTSGGLLATIPAARKDECMQELLQLRYTDTVVIGEIQERSDHLEAIVLRTSQ